mgnify:CR=1 FL=1
MYLLDAVHVLQGCADYTWTKLTAGALLFVSAFCLCTMSLPVKYQTPGKKTAERVQLAAKTVLSHRTFGGSSSGVCDSTGRLFVHKQKGETDRKHRLRVTSSSALG